MYNKEENIKSIGEYINNNKQDLTIEEIKYLEDIRDKIAQSENDEELLKCNYLLALFLTNEKLDNKIRKSQKWDKLFKWSYLLVKLLAILASIIYHYI
jgi:hypothetical protein